MRLIVLLSAALVVAMASYGAASPGYGAPPVGTGPYQAPPQQVPHYPAPHQFFYGSSSSSSSSSSSESSSSSSESSESNEAPPKRGQCSNNLTMWEACPKFVQESIKGGAAECLPPKIKPILLKDHKQRLSLLCETSDKDQMVVIVVNGQIAIAGGTGTQEAIVTCRGSDVWTAIGTPAAEKGADEFPEQVFFTNAWCLRVKEMGGRRRRQATDAVSDSQAIETSTYNLETTNKA